jgi:hypothetical protein
LLYDKKHIKKIRGICKKVVMKDIKTLLAINEITKLKLSKAQFTLSFFTLANLGKKIIPISLILAFERNIVAHFSI